MKFVENIYSVSRIGNFIDIPSRWNIISLRTPTCLTYTRAGTLPHITKDTLHHIDRDVGYSNLSLHPLPTVINFKSSVEEFGGNYAKFIGLPDQPFHLSVQNPACATPSGYNTKNSVSLFTHTGKKTVTSDDFMSIIKSYLPFSYQALCDSDTPKTCSNKRLNKAVDNSLKFLDQCLRIHSQSDNLKDIFVFGTIEGGYNIELRKKSAIETAKRDVDAFIIDGFYTDENEAMNLNFEDIKELLSEVVVLLPPEKPRMINGPFRPYFMLQAVKCGIDLFDSSYPFILTEIGNSLNLAIDIDDNHKLKKTKYAFELNLFDEFYADKFCPLTKGCECYACKQFTCAYVHHLLVAHELLAKVLLMIHNMYQFSMFFRQIREAIESNSFDKLEKRYSFTQT